MKKLKNVLLDGNGNIISNYLDEIGNNSVINIKEIDLTDDEIIVIDNLKSLIQSKLDLLPKQIEKVYDVELLENIFFISGENFQPKSFKTDLLSTSVLVTGTDLTQKQVSDNLYSFVLSSIGSPLISISAPFVTGKVTINGIEMDYQIISSQSGNIMSNATQLVVDLFNS